VAEDLDNMLREYLEHEKSDPIRERLKALSQWQLDHDARDTERFNSILRTLDGHNYRITGLEAKANKLEAEVENTGNHEVQALRRKSDRIDSTVFRVVVGVLLVVLGAGIYAGIRDISQGNHIQLPIDTK
jgi:hypothetical protein